MSFLVLCTFDLKHATQLQYQTAYEELAKLGLSRVHKTAEGGQFVIPTTTVMGEFSGVSAAKVRDDMCLAIKSALAFKGLKSEVFVVVGGVDWAWGGRTT